MLLGRRRIMVVGSGGAGKSTFARELGGITGLPVLHLDRLFWKPGWTPTPSDEWRCVVEELVARPDWIIDGNYGSTLALRVERCDAIVFFDVNRFACLWGVLKRVLRHHGTVRPDMGEDCPEHADWEFVRWIWNFPRTSRPSVIEAIRSAPEGTEVVAIRSRRAASRLLAALRASAVRRA